MLKRLLLIICIFFTIFIATNLSKAVYTYENVSYEVALSKIMIDSGIFIESQNTQVLNSIIWGYSYPDLSDSIKPFNPDFSPYEYYWFFQKAIDYTVVEYDTSWNKIIYKLIDNINSINPKSMITQAQFDKLAFVISKIGSSLVPPYVWNWLSSITVDSTTWDSPFIVNFKWNTTLPWWWYTYEWDYWNWWDWYWKNVSYVYVLSWTYEVKLLVTDKDWNIWTSTITILVWWTNSCSIDTDGDSIDDCGDACPLVYWDALNSWCPIFEISKPSTKNSWYECSYFGKTSVIYWHYVCNTCPCNNFADFNADVRKCDLILPVLLSPDWKEIYSKWNYFQVKE